MHNGTETTITFNADITIVYKGELDFTKYTAKDWEKHIAYELGADNVLISDLKYFVNDGKDAVCHPH